MDCSFFFFSSRRRHTRFKCDWSSDVCSSDLLKQLELTVKGPAALELLQTATCNDVSKLDDGRAQYNGLLYPTGGFVDDILIYRNAADDYFVVVNASNSDKDYEWIADLAKGKDVEVRNVSADYAQLALQGPEAERILQPMTHLPLPPMPYSPFPKRTVHCPPPTAPPTGHTATPHTH